MKRILVPLNHRQGNMAAILAAARLADSFEAVRIELLYVREPEHATAADQILYEAREILEGAGYKMQFIRLEGRVGERIVRFATVADLVVMRNQRRSDGDALSPTTSEVVRHCPRPVLVITDEMSDLANPLFAYNGSPQSRRAVQSALTLLGPSVMERGAVMVATADEQMAERLLTEVVAMGEAAGVALTPLWRAGSPGDVIVEQVAAGAHDLLIMGAYGRSWVRHRMFGSTTRRVARECRFPLWMSC